MGCFTGEFYAQSLRMTTQVKIIFPDTSNDVDPVIEGEPAVLYLLHGLCANAGEWTRFSKIEYYAKKYNLIIIMPEVQRSFYTDMKNGPAYFTYIADELPSLCAKWFCLPKIKEKTFIAGESMGGYGATKIALNRPNQYGAVASLSGVMDIAHLMQQAQDGKWLDFLPYEVKNIFGDASSVPLQDDVLHLVQALAKNPLRPRLFQCCGTEDFLWQDNINFCNVARNAGYGHTWVASEGDHEWPYWDKAIQRAIQFFYGLDIETTPIY